MENKDNSTNFWISYADLMAGLLFVFILLIGAIIVKYSLLQSESKLLEKTLKDEKSALEQNKKKLKIKEEKIKNALSELKQTKSELLFSWGMLYTFAHKFSKKNKLYIFNYSLIQPDVRKIYKQQIT